MLDSEKAYMKLIGVGCSPQMARDALPISLKTEIVVTYNLRQWKLFFTQRTNMAAHPQMRQLACPLLKVFVGALPEIYGNLSSEVRNG